MKLQSHTLTLEGNPEEIIKVYSALSSGIEGNNAPSPSETTAIEGEDDREASFEAKAKPLNMHEGDKPKPMSVAMARSVLSRRRLSPAAKKMLLELYKAHPEKVSAPTLRDALGFNGLQLGGLFGALGKRTNATEGFQPNTYFIDYEYNNEEGYWTYGIPEEVCEALRLEQIA
jgi:hypothetical protein